MQGHAYGSVYAIAQTAVSLAYGLGPLIGGQLVEVVGFPAIMQTVGVLNILYCPWLIFLGRVSRPNGENEGEEMPWKMQWTTSGGGAQDEKGGGANKSLAQVNIRNIQCWVLHVLP